MRYTFKEKVHVAGKEVTAEFEKASTSALVRVINKPTNMRLDEKMCKMLFEEARTNKDNSRASYASADSENHVRAGFYAIQSKKKELGIPLDCGPVIER